MRTLAFLWCATLLATLVAGCTGGGKEAPVELGPGQGTLRGVVVTAAIVPIEGAKVTIEPSGLENVTDADGEFEIGPLEPGAYSLSVRAPGYAPQRVAVEVAAGPGALVNVVLTAVTTDVPYSELLHYEAFIECSYAQNVGGVVGGDFSCFGVTDLVLGVKIDNDVNSFQFRVNAGGFKGLLYEMVWEPQSTMPDFAGFIRSVVPVGEAGGLGLEHQYWVNSSASPLVAWVYQGIENDGAYEGDVFHPDPAAAGDYEILVGGVTSGSQPAEVAFALNQYLDVFVTLFYNALGDESYSALTAA
ncbi:MAG TPA: carboxypeptidase-like regulatory domain-containing protein [Candidatus Thermoplasmatota archaeon]|nr:carboxypeptidase-like regulatory domain-containing protein [Candidatus Thermoplasmatota archaeon]